MRNLNHDAIFARYKQSGPTHYVFKRVEGSKFQALKALRCWLYQCSEGDIPERPLYLEMSEVSGYLALDIVRKLPEYEAAEWG